MCCSAESTIFIAHTPCLYAAGAFKSGHAVKFDHSYTALLFFSLTLCAWLYYSIYSSDPGSPAEIGSSQPQGPPCQHCGVTSPTIRVRHDFTTGAGLTLHDCRPTAYKLQACAAFTAGRGTRHLLHSACDG